MSVDSPDRKSVALLITAVSFRSKLDHSVKGNFDVGEIGLRKIMEICVQATENGLEQTNS